MTPFKVLDRFEIGGEKVAVISEVISLKGGLFRYKVDIYDTGYFIRATTFTHNALAKREKQKDFGQ